MYKKNTRLFNLFYFSSIYTFIGIFIIEFNYKLVSNELQNIDYAKLELHDSQHHFCRGSKDRIIIDSEREFIERPLSEYFEYRNGQTNIFSHDEFGYRINQKSLNTFNGHKERQVWVLGDSLTRGSLSDNTETIPAQLSSFNSDKVSFRNFGIGGYGILNAKRTLEWALHEFSTKPELIIFISYINDLSDDNRTAKRLSAFENNQADPLKYSIGGQFQKYISKFIPKLLLSRIKALRKTYSIVQSNIKNNFFNKELNNNKPDKHIGMMNNSRKNLKYLIKIIRKNEIPVVFFLVPPSPEILKFNYAKLHEKYNTFLERFTKEEQIPYLFISHKLMQDEIKNSSLDSKIDTVSKLYGFPDRHLKEEGYFVASKIIARKLKTIKVLNDYNIINDQFINKTNYLPFKENCPS